MKTEKLTMKNAFFKYNFKLLYSTYRICHATYKYSGGHLL